MMFKLLNRFSLVVFLSISFSSSKVLSIGLKAGGPTEIITCFNGYVLSEDGRCVREINQEPNPICPEASSTNRGFCRVEVPYIIRCPEGYNNANGKCSYVTKIDASFFCPTGFTDSGEDCIHVSPSDPVPQCEQGELINGSCVSVVRQPPIVNARCPSNTIFENNGCWQVLEEFVCTGQFPSIYEEYKSSAGVSRSLENDKARPRHLGAPKKRLSGESEMVPVTKPRRSVVKLIKQICQRMIQVDSEIVAQCSVGFVQDGSNCIQERILPPQLVCPTSGVLLSVDGCPPIINRIPKTARCPDGTPPISNKCDSVTLATPELFCPSEFTNNGEIHPGHHINLVTPINRYLNVLCEGYLPAILECPPGLQMINGRCIGKAIRPALTFRISENFKPVQELTPPSQPQRGTEEKTFDIKKKLTGYKRKGEKK